MLHFRMAHSSSRRNFLRTAPLAAAFPLTDKLLAAQTASTPAPVPFQLIAAAQVDESSRKLHATPGIDNLFTNAGLPFTVVLTVEEKHSAEEFEWHEGRDHILQILDGETFYEVGGKPQSAHNTKPGEWLAPVSDGAMKYTLRTGDMLIIPRGTPHKRSTPGSVTFYLISVTGK